MVNRGEEKVWVQMNVVPRSTGNANSGTRELTLKCKLKCYFKPMNNPLGVSPSKGKQGATRGKEKICGFDSHLGQKIFSLPRVAPCFPLLGLTPSGLFMGLK